MERRAIWRVYNMKTIVSDSDADKLKECGKNTVVVKNEKFFVTRRKQVRASSQCWRSGDTTGAFSSTT